VAVQIGEVQIGASRCRWRPWELEKAALAHCHDGLGEEQAGRLQQRAVLWEMRWSMCVGP
jgi:hypothetical protein